MYKNMLYDHRCNLLHEKSNAIKKYSVEALKNGSLSFIKANVRVDKLETYQSEKPSEKVCKFNI